MVSSQESLHIPSVAKRGHELTLLATLEEIDLSPRALNALHKAGVHLVGQLVQLTEFQISRMPALGRRTVNEIKGRLATCGLELGSSIPGWDVDAARAERKRLGPRVRRHLAEQDTGKIRSAHAYLEDELHGIVSAVAAGRNVELLERRWGFSGSAPETLETVGRAFGLTRERVRQLESKARERLSRRWHEAPCLERALQLISAAAPDTPENMSASLMSNGLTRRPLSVEAVIGAAELLGRGCGIGLHAIGDVQFVDESSRRPRLPKIAAELRKATQKNGCANVERLALQVGGRLDDADRVRRLLSILPETVWLSPDQSWAMSRQPARNRLTNLITKVLSVAPEVHVSELRSAVSKPHRISYVPPRSVLLEFCRATGCARVANDSVLRSDAFSPCDLGWVEQTFVDALRTLGSPVAREDLEEFCIDQRGMNFHTFYVYLSYSPLILRLAQGVYSLVGARFALGAVEEIRARQRHPPSISEYGWLDDGRLWCALPLDRATLKVGNRNLPTFVAELAQGEWPGTFRDGVSAGTLTITEQRVSDLRTPLGMAGAEPGDTLRMTFNLADRSLCLEVGGEELATVDPQPDTVDEDDDDENIC